MLHQLSHVLTLIVLGTVLLHTQSSATAQSPSSLFQEIQPQRVQTAEWTSILSRVLAVATHQGEPSTLPPSSLSYSVIHRRFKPQVRRRIVRQPRRRRRGTLKIDQHQKDYLVLASKVSNKSQEQIQANILREREQEEGDQGEGEEEEDSNEQHVQKSKESPDSEDDLHNTNSNEFRDEKENLEDLAHSSRHRGHGQIRLPLAAMKPIIQGHGKGDGKTELTSIISKHTTVRQYTKNYNGVKKGTLDSNPKIIQGSLPPAVFYVPHQDDDALAMSLAIREHIEAGRRVIVHLYSDGINTQLRDIVSGTAPCPLQHPPHQFNLTLQDVVTGRTHEFRQSLHALGVQDEDILETGWSDIEPVKDYITFKAKVKSLILGYETKYPGASHKCISGEYDRDSFGRNPTHRACWDVATELLDQYPFGWPSSGQVWDFRFYRTYTYYRPEEARTAQFIRALPQYLPYKQRSLDQYKRWDPSNGELAWGYHSVKFLIDAAYYDPYVYVDMLANDPTNPENLAGVVNLRRIQSGQGRTMFPNAWKKKTQTLKDMNKQSSKNRKQSPREKKPKQHKQHTHQAPTEGQEEGVGQDQEHVLLQQHVVDHKVTSTQPKWAQVERLPKISKQRQGSKDALWEKAEQDLAKEILRKFDEAMMSEGLSYDYSKARKRPIVVGLV